ncbi:MAG TPA: FtsK/SpoIIIE domain-containing protein [Galbitalea sp.]|nr:FtsK/SpoIIIE domain-containing protein [Galbitalea sp.]
MVAPPRSVLAPRVPEAPAPRRFPLIATLAPIGASVLLFAVTRSAFTLVFALLGPVVAVATTADSLLHRRGSRRRDAARLDREFADARAEVDRAHEGERADLDRAHPRGLALASETVPWGPSQSGTIVRLGAGECASALDLRAVDHASQEPRLGSLVSHAARLPGAPIVVDAASGIGFVGSPILATAVARATVLQLAARLSPATFRVLSPGTSEWDWTAELPHPVDRGGESGIVVFIGDGISATVGVAGSRAGLPSSTAIRVDVKQDGTAACESEPSAFRPEFVSAESALAAAKSLRASAVRSGLAIGVVPDTVEFSHLSQDSDAGLSAVVGTTHDGPLVLDLVAEGPHAIVGGTTGSGKSELLGTWVLAMAAGRSPSVVTFLFIDFKGGAAFDSLRDLPHCVGLMTDLDPEHTLRALASLGAELRYREELLRERGLRSIDDPDGDPPFPRLVIVVDEYAALLETHAGLHSVFADIAARGRSLGVHLVLCSQRPPGVVRDSILANCALRILLRVLTAADSVAVLGTDAAASLPARPAGRALVSTGGESPRPFQVARSRESDVRAVSRRWASAAHPRRPWLPPLPAQIERDTLGALTPDDSIPFGLADLPERQAQHPARYRPVEQGSLLIVGAARSGKTGALAALAAAPSTVRVDALPRDLPRLWDALHAVRAVPASSVRLLLLDDLDAIVAGCDENYRSAFVDLLTELLRDAPNIRFAFTVQRVSGILQPLVALCGSLLVLRMPSRQEHVLAGGNSAEYSQTLAPGGAHWRGHRVQVFATESIAPPAGAPDATVLDPAAAITVVSTRPDQFVAQLREVAPGRSVTVLGGSRFDARPDGNNADVLVADPDAWQAQWSLLGTLQRTTDLVFDGCSLAEVRAITRSRELPPPFARGERTLWLRSRDGELVRARLP